MHAFMGRNGRALILALALAVFGAVPAAAQRQQARQQVQQRQTNDDFRLSPELGFEYRLSPQWRLTFDTRLFLNQAMSNVQKLEMQPGVEYALSPNWSVAGGYVQYPRLPAQVSTTRGPDEDVTHGTTFGVVKTFLASASEPQVEPRPPARWFLRSWAPSPSWSGV